MYDLLILTAISNKIPLVVTVGQVKRFTWSTNHDAIGVRIRLNIVYAT